MAQVGRISGPLLTANLERNGIDLAFRNNLDTDQLLYLNVTNGFIGVNKDAPAYQIDINGATNVPTLISSTSASIADLNFQNNNEINNLNGDINLNASTARYSDYQTLKLITFTLVIILFLVIDQMQILT